MSLTKFLTSGVHLNKDVDICIVAVMNKKTQSHQKCQECHGCEAKWKCYGCDQYQCDGCEAKLHKN